jgi:hypothetical protein
VGCGRAGRRADTTRPTNRSVEHNALGVKLSDSNGAVCARHRPHERTPLRRGQANGFRPKMIQIRMGPRPMAAVDSRAVFIPAG